MIPSLPCGSFPDDKTAPGAFYVAAFEPGEEPPHHVGEYRIENVIRALRALQACGYDDVDVGHTERFDQTHLTLIGLDGEARVGDKRHGCIAVFPVEVD